MESNAIVESPERARENQISAPRAAADPSQPISPTLDSSFTDILSAQWATPETANYRDA
ncbi:hypothetical protein FB639_005346, partial [Coemansia asiatica]